MFGAAGAIFITLPSKKLGYTGSNLVFVGTLGVGMFLSNQLSNIFCSLRSRLFFDNRYGFGAQNLLNTEPLMEGAVICLNIDFCTESMHCWGSQRPLGSWQEKET